MEYDEMKITFYKNMWLYKPLVKHLENAGFKYGKDMQGWQSKIGHKYIQFESENAYMKALEIKKELEDRMNKIDN